MTLDEERQERKEHLVSRCDMSIEDIKSEIDFVLGQPKREWVGLTDEEIYDYADKFLYQHGSNYGIRSFGKAIEAKLKEKNT